MASAAELETEESQETTPTEETTADLVRKKSGTSMVWDYFGYEVTDVLQKRVLCRTCRRKVATSRGNTTNLRQHLF